MEIILRLNRTHILHNMDPKDFPFQTRFLMSLLSVVVASSWGVAVNTCAQAAGFIVWKHGSGIGSFCVENSCSVIIVDPAKYQEFIEGVRDGEPTSAKILY